MKIIKPAKKSPKQDKHKPQYTKVFHMKLSKHYDLKIYLIAFFKVFFFFFWWAHAHGTQNPFSPSTMCLWGWNSGPQAGWEAPLPTKPFNWP